MINEEQSGNNCGGDLSEIDDSLQGNIAIKIKNYYTCVSNNEIMDLSGDQNSKDELFNQEDSQSDHQNGSSVIHYVNDIYYEKPFEKNKNQDNQGSDNDRNHTTEKIGIMKAPFTKSKNQMKQQECQAVRVGDDIKKKQIRKKKQKNEEMKAKKNELKNLPKYFMKHIKNRVMKKLEDEQNRNDKQELVNELEKLNDKKFKFNLKSFTNFLNVRQFSTEAINYITSFNFLDDLLQSDRQIEVSPQIKYTHKVFEYARKVIEECNNSNNQFRWKNS